MNIIGTILDSSGYSIHCRELANALNKQTEVKLSVPVQVGQETLLTDKEVEMIKREDDDINLIITNPINWAVNCTAKRNWVYLVWEGDKIPDSFIDECLNENIEYIIVPSNHTREALWNTYWDGGVNEGDICDTDKKFWGKVKVIPHGVDLDKFYPKQKETETFRFITNKGFRNMEDRGGIQYAIKAYLEEFTKKDNVELIVKINPAYGIPDLNKLMTDFGFNENSPKIIFETANWKYEELVNFYKEGDVFVSPSRAEAFNIPCLEAMACGLPVITTHFGGQGDYTNNNNGWIIGGELTEIQHDLMYEGVCWITPNMDELKLAMREAYKNKSKEKSKNALDTARKYTWDLTSKKILELI